MKRVEDTVAASGRVEDMVAASGRVEKVFPNAIGGRTVILRELPDDATCTVHGRTGKDLADAILSTMIMLGTVNVCRGCFDEYAAWRANGGGR